ncbi:MAG TPA: ATP-binding protein [Candidatus Limnocylindrales bacterium]
MGRSVGRSGRTGRCRRSTRSRPACRRGARISGRCTCRRAWCHRPGRGRSGPEALANAVKHGNPPIVVRYTSTDSGVSLSIDDAGPGIAPDAGEEAERSGHFGLLNMEQRAEAIGAILDVRRWPTGGTHVALEWRAH